ncbi:MAG: dihydropyrimidine dehydrogenase [Rubrivivax sp. SCN 70-15]|nr:MAG: dihydropyrimidine dehydrogenase [Rubrivivax sp. SCN 70-15]
MTEPSAPDLRSARLAPAQYEAAFADAVPPLTRAQALVEAERCLYCFDAPCTRACPTAIDVPSFIRRIADDNLRGAARTILDPNPLGGTCARACPTEVLCEQVCVRNTEQRRPVEIGRLQRYALDAAIQRPVGAGPAGLACAFALARRGHEVVIHDARAAPGGLNEYGLAAYKMAGGFAQAEVAWLLAIGGIALRPNWRLEGAQQLAALRADFDAVYLAVGLARTHRLGIAGEGLGGVRDAVDFIAELRQAKDLSRLPIGRRVVVIGGGMTAVDAAVQSRLLGAEEVHIAYRRGPQEMPASPAEREWAQTRGVTIHFGLTPEEIVGSAGHVAAVRFARAGGGEQRLDADLVFKAIGQRLDEGPLQGSGLTLQGGRVLADDDGRTGVPRLFAGGDCRAGGRDLTVEAVADGQRAAAAIHAELTA